MPELPEVETVGRGLSKSILNKRITRVELNRPDLRAPLPKDLTKRITGQSIREIKRRAKYLLLRTNGGETILLHLGMSGRVTTGKDSGTREKHDHVALHFTGGTVLLFNDPRRFGRLDLMKTGDEEKHPLLRHLGPEPLDKSFTAKILGERLKGKKTAIKLALLDQTVVAGIGNIYASEALFWAGISPTRPAGQITGARAEKLVPAIKKVLNAAIKAGGSSLRDYRQASGELGYFQHKFAVYDKAAKPCPGCTCDWKETGGIRQSVLGGRSTFYCSTRQR